MSRVISLRMGPEIAPAYHRRRPKQTLFYQMVEQPYPDFYG